jgi:hypothetical protein
MSENVREKGVGFNTEVEKTNKSYFLLLKQKSTYLTTPNCYPLQLFL